MEQNVEKIAYALKIPNQVGNIARTCQLVFFQSVSKHILYNLLFCENMC